MKILAFLIPVIILSISFIPLWMLLKRSKQHQLKKPQKTTKKYMLIHYILLFGLIGLATTLMSFSKATYAVQTVDQVAQSAGALALCFKYISSALAVGIGCIGAGIAISNGISAAIGACSENEKTFSKALMFVAFGEGIAIYGLVVSFLILFVA